MGEEHACPHCGARVYATDSVCMSCGQSLAEERPLGGRKQAPRFPPVKQAAGRRPTPEVAPPVTYRIVGAFGGFWDIFPWLAIAYGAVLGMIGLGRFPHLLAAPLYVSSALVGMALMAWVVVDVLYLGVNLVWAPIAVLSYPFGLVIYLLLGRR